MEPRLATISDVPALAAIHVQCWAETYTGLLPAAEIAKRDLPYRQKLWRQILEGGAAVSFLEHTGFAHLGPQRSAELKAEYPCELMTLYVLEKAHGTGAAQQLLRHALPNAFAPFTADVLKGNGRATRFYEKIGGTALREVPYDLGGDAHADITFGWLYPPQFPD